MGMSVFLTRNLVIIKAFNFRKDERFNDPLIIICFSPDYDNCAKKCRDALTPKSFSFTHKATSFRHRLILRR